MKIIHLNTYYYKSIISYMLHYLIILLFLLSIVESTYDVVIIGSGPGGLVAAEYITRNHNISVMMIEAGGPSLSSTGGTDIPNYAKKSKLTSNLTIFDIPGEYDNNVFSDKNEKYRQDWIKTPYTWMGKMIGGCSSLNAALYFRTPDSYIEKASWPFSISTVNQGFNEIEKMFGVTTYPSSDHIHYVEEPYSIVGKAMNSVGYLETDLNSEIGRNNKNQTYGYPPYAIRNGLRDSPAKTFYNAMKNRKNFKMITFAAVLYIVHTNEGKATQVVYKKDNKIVNANISTVGTVLMASGALSTPKILIQSGIGPYRQLKLLNKLKETNFDFTGVDNNTDNWIINENVGLHIFDTAVTFPSFQSVNMKSFQNARRPENAIEQYIYKNQTGPWANPGPVLIAYESFHLNNKNDEYVYDFQTTVLPHGTNEFYELPNGFSTPVYLNNPVSRDFASFDSNGNWLGSTNNSFYLSNKNDLKAMVYYVEKLRTILLRDPLTKALSPRLEENLTDWVQNNHNYVTHHFGGSCYTSMNENDYSRCADKDFRVLGTKNIFLTDGSLMKEGTVNPYGFIMYIGNQAGKIISREIKMNLFCQSAEIINDNTTGYLKNRIKFTDYKECCAFCFNNKKICNNFHWDKSNGGTCSIELLINRLSTEKNRISSFRPLSPIFSTFLLFITLTSYLTLFLLINKIPMLSKTR